VFNWFKKNRSYHQPLKVDIHSHLLPAIDDGVKSLQEAEAIILQLRKLGYEKIVTTPHIMSDVYRNTPEIIGDKLNLLRQHLVEKKIDLVVEAAAEYYLDESLYRMVETDQPLLTFGKNYLLFETSFLTEPWVLNEFIFMAATRGYKPILAHPERYLYLQQNLLRAQDLFERGVLFQMNISSITGYYSRPVQQMAFKLIDRGWVHWLGSDCHHLQHAQLIENAISSKYFQKALTLPLLNNTL
jgi:tyrosine-protein phosphatase YwqE